jgi:hypothetical protein
MSLQDSLAVPGPLLWRLPTLVTHSTHNALPVSMLFKGWRLTANDDRRRPVMQVFDSETTPVYGLKTGCGVHDVLVLPSSRGRPAILACCVDHLALCSMNARA